MNDKLTSFWNTRLGQFLLRCAFLSRRRVETKEQTDDNWRPENEEEDP